jgi:hypothetical protein
LNLENAEFSTLFYLCKAWQQLLIGYQNRSVQKFSEAELYFNQANESIKEKNLKNLMYANSIFCEILKLSTQYDDLKTPNKDDIYFPKIHNLMKRAIEFYDDGGFEKEKQWAYNALKDIKM